MHFLFSTSCHYLFNVAAIYLYKVIGTLVLFSVQFLKFSALIDLLKKTYSFDQGDILGFQRPALAHVNACRKMRLRN